MVDQEEWEVIEPSLRRAVEALCRIYDYPITVDLVMRRVKSQVDNYPVPDGFALTDVAMALASEEIARGHPTVEGESAILRPPVDRPEDQPVGGRPVLSREERVYRLAKALEAEELREREPGLTLDGIVLRIGFAPGSTRNSKRKLLQYAREDLEELEGRTTERASSRKQSRGRPRGTWKKTHKQGSKLYFLPSRCCRL